MPLASGSQIIRHSISEKRELVTLEEGKVGLYACGLPLTRLVTLVMLDRLFHSIS